MKVLHIIQKLVPGGGQRTLYNIVKYNKNIQHYILTYLYSDIYKSFFTELDNVEVITMKSLLDYKRETMKLNYDIVNYHWWPGMQLFENFFKQCRIPVVLTLQEQCRPPLHDFYYVAGSQDNFRYLDKVPRQRKEVICLGIDPDSIEHRENIPMADRSEMVIGRISTIIRTKIPTNLLEVYSAIQVDGCKLKFIICGAGDNELIKELNEEKRRYPDCDIVIDDDSDVSNKFKWMDSFVYWLPEGESESFGLVIIEAMACGVPVIAQNRGALSEIIQHNVNGFLFENVSEINDYINLIADDQNLREMIIAKAEKTVDELFTAKRMAADYAVLYQKLINENYKIHE